MSGETEESVSGWTIDTLHQHLVGMVADKDGSLRREMAQMRDFFNERHKGDQIALDKAFASADRAMILAFESAQRALDQRTATLDKEYHEHLIQVRQETVVAFEASDRAISKAETANEKRFESVNEFRGQLGDQAARLMSRTEYDAAHSALVAKVDDNAKNNAERLVEVNRRLDLNQGKNAGISAFWGFVVAGVSLLVAIIGIVAFFNAGS